MSQSGEKILERWAEQYGACERFLSFAELKARGIVTNRTTLARWIETLGFPPGVLLGPNSRKFPEGEVYAWVERRRRDNAGAVRAA